LRAASLDSLWTALDERGYPDQFLEGLRVIRPDLKMVGRAVTLRYLPTRPDLAAEMQAAGPMLVVQAAEATCAGDVLVVDCGGCTEAGFVGDLIAARFVAQGGVGIVVDGSVRDLSALLEMPLALYVRDVHAAMSKRRLVGVDWNVPIRCANVTVRPGDLMVGDAEGVLAIPAGLAEEIADAALALDGLENYLRQQYLEAGRSLRGTYPNTPPEVVAEYEAWKAQHPPRLPEAS
jgi:regulator of RNase E activity RraA